MRKKLQQLNIAQDAGKRMVTHEMGFVGYIYLIMGFVGYIYFNNGIGGLHLLNVWSRLSRLHYL
jgi:hypothetical protein